MTPRHTRAAIVAACRKLMQAGRLRPTMRACCARAGWSKSTGHRAVGPVAVLYERQLAEIETRAPESWALDVPAGGSAL